MLTHSFEDLTQTFRVLLESNQRLKQLIDIDRAEAVGTVETAINAKLNAFHNLYDLMAQELGKPVDWYSVPELCIILAIRNARHHNKANRIRSLWNYHNQVCEKPTNKKKYLYVNSVVPEEEEGGGYFDIPLSWSDLDDLLTLPRNESRLRANARDLIRNYLNADKFEEEAKSLGFRKSQIFFNFVPLSLNAGIALHPFVKEHVTPDSVESEFFLQHFENTASALTKEHDYQEFTFSLPE